MHLLVDGQALQTPSSRMRGIGRYSSNLLRALAPARPHWRIEVVQNAALPPIAAEDLGGLPVVSFQPPMPAGVGQQEINERYYADWLTAQHPDGVLILSHCEGWEALVPCFCGERPRVFGIAYDLIPLLYPEYYLRAVGVSHWYAHRFRHLLHSDALLAISEATARDVRSLGGEQAPQVVNIAGAVDPLFAPLSPEELAVRAPQVRERFGLHREFLLYVGAADYRKNLRGAIRAFGALPPECREPYDLAVVCRVSAAEQAAIRETARQAGVASSLKLICSAGDEELRALYALCRLFFFPSLYEGLGLPVLEALHCGAPVVTSQGSSLPEYAGPVSWLGDPSSPEAMAGVLRQALAEPRDLRREAREAFARTFTWQKTAERACTAMERGGKRRATRRRRLAWVTPLAPATPQMAEHAAALLPLLSDRFDVELIVGHGPMAVPEALSRNHLILAPQEMAARHTALPYDMFVYQFSSSRHHLFMLDLLREFPGLVVLHDFVAADVARLAEINLLRPRNARGPGVYAPGLGLLVPSAWAWQQVRQAVDTPTVHLPPPLPMPALQGEAAQSHVAQHHDPRRVADAYARWIDLAIARHQESDGLWRGFVMRCLAGHPEAAGAIIDSWAALRAQGQQPPAEHQQYDAAATSRPAA